jgi:hypothetical protein
MPPGLVEASNAPSLLSTISSLFFRENLGLFRISVSMSCFLPNARWPRGGLFRKLVGGEADFLGVRMGNDYGRGLFLGMPLLFNVVRILLYDFGVDGVVLAEGKLLIVRGGSGMARKEVPGVILLVAADG